MNIPTAEEFLDKHKDIQSDFDYETTNMMIRFAKLHVEAALKSASETKVSGTYSSTLYERDGDDKNKIKNSYPLSNIK
tara:strand:+ start:1524 stop:1757 length:234 start_codon:yes stop_codon:yes gene_type:complete